MIVSFQGQDIPVKILHFYIQPPNPYCWESDMDFYGYTELEYELPMNVEDSKELYNCVLNALMKELNNV